MTRPSPLAGQRWTSAHTLLLAGILVVGVAARLAYVDRPLDQRVINPWRQADYTQIARNFHREGMNILYPRIDWRGDTPGYAEMELPLLPWIGAALYRVFGPHEQILRAVAAFFASASMLLFAALARRLLPPVGALFAVVAVAINPLLIVLASSIQPEPVLDFFALLTIILLWRWNDRPSMARLLAAAAAAAFAILAKLPAAYLGLVIAYTVVRRLGWRALRDPQVYAAALLAVVPPVAWYTWAHGFWLQYGNSLGVSNESHLIGWDVLLPPFFLLGILQWETVGVFTPIGWLLALAALALPRRQVEPLLVWYGSVFLFYVLAGRTTADRWAYYYHMLSVAPAALLMGGGLVALLDASPVPVRFAWLARRETGVAWVLAAGTLALLLAATVFLIVRRDRREELLPMYRCARQFASLVPRDSRIVVRGGAMYDEHGHPVAHNESMAFAWMDRKGFNYGDEQLGIDTLAAIAARGGRYWMVNRYELDGDLRPKVEQRHRHIADCGDSYSLYELRPNAHS